jgi:transcriptional regulator with XRE-family HTH domain
MHARAARGVSGNQLAKLLGISQSKVARWDRGQPVPSAEDVVRIVDALEITGDERDRIVAMAGPPGADTWLASGTPGVSDQLATVLDAERDARRITEYNPLVIPGKLQTRDYAHATISDPGVTPAERDVRVTMRMGRVAALRSRENPPEMLALIGEPAIRGRLGGVGVMIDQLRQVHEYAQLPNVTVQVVSLSTEQWHPGYLPGFYVYEFDEHFPPMVYLEHYTFGEFLVDVPPDTHVQRYLNAVPWLQDVAFSPDDSLALIAEQITALEAAEDDRSLAQGVTQPGRRGVRADSPHTGGD